MASMNKALDGMAEKKNFTQGKKEGTVDGAWKTPPCLLPQQTKNLLTEKHQVNDMAY